MSGETAAMIVLNYNDYGHTGELLEKVGSSDIVTHIIVVDNSSVQSEYDPKWRENDKVDIIKAPNNGYARGNNAGIRFAGEHYGSPDYIIISNPDIDVKPEAIEKCIAFLDGHGDYAAAAPHMLLPDGSPHHLSGWKEKSFLCDLAYSSGILSRLIGMYRETYPPEHWKTAYSQVDCIAGSFFVIKYDVFKQIGFFDENTFLFYEEDIIGFKLKSINYRLAVLNDCGFVHYEGVSAGRNHILKKYKTMQKSRLYFQTRYRKVNAPEHLALLLATGLGLIEKALKALVFRIVK